MRNASAYPAAVFRGTLLLPVSGWSAHYKKPGGFRNDVSDVREVKYSLGLVLPPFRLLVVFPGTFLHIVTSKTVLV